jgi:hypothetical protein
MPKKNEPPIKATVVFEVDIAYQDFLSRVCAHMGLDPNAAQLGWRCTDDTKRDGFIRLATLDDLTQAFARLMALKTNRRKKPVVMEICDLVSLVGHEACRYNSLSNVQKPKEPEPAKERLGLKTTDTTYREELDLVKAKLKCLMHPGPHRWC